MNKRSSDAVFFLLVSLFALLAIASFAVGICVPQAIQAEEVSAQLLSTGTHVEDVWTDVSRLYAFHLSRGIALGLGLSSIAAIVIAVSVFSYDRLK